MAAETFPAAARRNSTFVYLGMRPTIQGHREKIEIKRKTQIPAVSFTSK